MPTLFPTKVILQDLPLNVCFALAATRDFEITKTGDIADRLISIVAPATNGMSARVMDSGTRNDLPPPHSASVPEFKWLLASHAMPAG